MYYPNAKEVFEILEPDGISYYIIGKKKCEIKTVKNISSTFSKMNNEVHKQIDDKFVLLNCADSIINKCFKYNKITFKINDFTKRYKVVAVTKAPGMTHANKKDTPIYITSILTIREDYNGGEPDRISIFSTDSINEAKSFISYMYTRLARFLFLSSVCKLTGVYNDFDWRFVPAPEAFDHIFTDKELYEKYKLTAEEINIIESVIKERK